MTDNDKKIAAAFRKGVHSGRQQATESLHIRINLIIKTNAALLSEVMRLDRHEPVVGVAIPLAYARKLINKFRREGFPGYADHIEELIGLSVARNEEIFGLLTELQLLNSEDATGDANSD